MNFCLQNVKQIIALNIDLARCSTTKLNLLHPSELKENFKNNKFALKLITCIKQSSTDYIKLADFSYGNLFGGRSTEVILRDSGLYQRSCKEKY